ncbi:MAG: HdeA/HdeB family chaperone [Pseudolabrys sp.]
MSERPRALLIFKRSYEMRLRLICTAFAISLLPVTANAQITIDMGAIRCDQYLAMSPAQSRDFSAWMSGWLSYQTRREFVDIDLHQKNIANLKAWCQYHPQEGVMAGLQRGIGPQ